jgi:hypothetical protein
VIQQEQPVLTLHYVSSQTLAYYGSTGGIGSSRTTAYEAVALLRRIQ